VSTLVGRMAGAVSDLTIGTVIVLVHVALADRVANRERILPDARAATGTDDARVWPSQKISH
jgi:hypothetical protein